MRYLQARRVQTVASFALLVIVGAAATSDDDGLRRLAAMPRERRLILAENLREFDNLPRAEQAAIRAFDAKLADEAEEERKNDLAVLRRYHLWARRLTDAQRSELDSATPEQRLKLVNKLLADQRRGPSQRLPYFMIAEFGSPSPLVAAYQIRLWMTLSDAEKELLRKLPDAERLKRLDHLITEHKPAPIKTPPRQALDSLLPRVSKSRLYPFIKKFDDTKKDQQARDRFLDHYYFIENPPKKVAPERLLRFDQALPFWVRSGIESLPPEEARRRLTVFYRLVFDDGEMPEPKPKAGTAAISAPKPAATGKGATNPDSPF